MKRILPLMLGATLLAWSQSEVESRFVLHKHYILREPEMIDTFLKGFRSSLGPISVDTVEQVEIIDTEDNGVTINDLFLISPCGVLESITHLTEDLETQLEAWTDRRPLDLHTFPRAQGHELEEYVRDEESCIEARLIHALQRSYEGDQIGVYLTMDTTGYRFRLWNHDKTLIIPPEGGCLDVLGGGGARVDLLVEQSVDTVWVPDTVMVDLLYIVQSQTDSIWVGRQRASSPLIEEME